MTQLGAFAIVGYGVAITTSTTSNNLAIPLDDSGNPARYVAITTTAPAHICPGNHTILATDTDMIVTPYERLILNVAGFSYLAVLQQGATPGKVIVTPVEG